MKKVTQAIVMCGGKGTRILNLTKDLIPKSLIQFNGKPFLEILIYKIYNLGIKRIIFCTGHLSNQIENFINQFSQTKKLDIDLIISEESFPLGTAGALKLCSNHLKGDSSLVLNGDTYINYDLYKYVDWHFKNNYEISVMLSFVFNSSKFGSVEIDNEKIKKFEEKKINFFKFVYNGIFLSKNEYLNKIEYKFSNVEDTFFQDNIKRMYGYKSFSKFYDIGSLSGYNRAKKNLIF